ncbi:virulence protein [Anopheles sinensis]|uniref:Virulence protein n=1 Tax=Anopheles sinensis TaxID=74873 RepID=A0A084W524_ANOSI|nr:virulence protein [Anopheles sinensis]
MTLADHIAHPQSFPRSVLGMSPVCLGQGWAVQPDASASSPHACARKPLPRAGKPQRGSVCAHHGL